MLQAADWLGPFVEKEVHEVLAWKALPLNFPHVKADPHCRFDDDHSNFRSVADASILPKEVKVQISSILSVNEQVTALVTDGFTKVKARLSKAAVSTLEAGLDEPVDLETKGDVVAIRHVTTESTPYGPSDGFIQLVVEQIEYLFHLRKPIGQPTPIEERPRISQLIEEITSLRRGNHSLASGTREATPGRPNTTPRSAAISKAGNNAVSPSVNETPLSRRSLQLSQHSSPVKSPSTRRALATQIPNRQRSHKPTLAQDGFEVQEGANLAPPIMPRKDTMSTQTFNNVRNEAAVAHGTSALLNLLGKRKADDANISPPPKRHSSPFVDRPQEAQSIDARPQPLRQAGPPAAPSESVLQEEQRTDTRRSPEQTLQETSIPSVATSPPVPATRAISNAERAFQSPITNPSPPRPKVQTPPARQPRKLHKRHEVPADQQKLLDKPASWLPSLPGHQFPRPNVPIELLKRWNAQIVESAKSVAPSNSVTANGISSGVADKHVSTHKDPSSDSDNSESSEDELLDCEWEASPSQKRPQLPPDSTMESNAGNSTALELLQVAPTNAEQTTRIAPPSQPMRPFPPSASANPSPRTPIELPKRPDWIQRREPRPSPSQRAAVKDNAQVDGNQSERSQSTSRPSTAASVQHPASFMRSPSKPIKRPVSSVESTVVSTSRNTKSPQVSPVTVVKATQRSVGNPAREDNDMEMSVPRSLGQDPAIAHRQKRSEHFKSLRRREWIKANYNTSQSFQKQWQTLYKAYTKAHPKDAIRLSDFTETIEELYPKAEHSTPKLQQPDSSINVVSTSQQAPKVSADVEDTVSKVSELIKKPKRSSVSPLHKSKAPTQSTARDANIRPEPPDGILFRDYQTKAFPESISSKPASIVSTPSHKEFGPSTTNNRAASADHRLPPATEACPETRQANPNTKERAMDMEREAQVNTFAEFARAWKNIKPGGAFAVAPKPEKQKQKQSTRLNVLEWKL